MDDSKPSADSIIELVKNNDLERLKQFLKGSSPEELNERNNEGRTGLHEACHIGHTKMVSILLAAGANPNLQDAFLQTPLILAAEGQQSTAVEVLCQSQADKNVQDSFGRTALHWAARNCDLKSLTALLQPSVEGPLSIDLNKQTTSGETALHWLCAQPSGNLQMECLDALLSAGANANISNLDGCLPIDVTQSSDIKLILGKNIQQDAKAEMKQLQMVTDIDTSVISKTLQSKPSEENSRTQPKVSIRNGGQQRGFANPKKKQPKLKITLKK